MNKKVYIIIGVLLLLILGGAGLFLASRKSNTAQPLNTENTAMQTQPTTGASNQPIKGSLKSLLSSGTAQTCTYSTDATAGSVNGTVYVANGKMRGDFTSNAGSTTVSSHMIVDSSYSYFWTEGSKQGFKTAISQASPSVTPTSNSQAGSQGTDLNQTVSYTCSNWTEDDSKFAFPTDVTFTTFTTPSAAPSGTSTQSGTSNQSACSYCNSLSTQEQIASCKSSLHCQ